MNINFLTILFIVFYSNITGQIVTLDSFIKKNELTDFKHQNLILLDFWATWCGPCIPATQQLEYVQETYKDDIFMISITDEPNDIIRKFLQKKPIKLMVASDYDNVKKYNVTHRPYAVLLNLKGDVIWQGKPSALTDDLITKFSLKNKNSKSVNFKELVIENNNIIKKNSIDTSNTKDEKILVFNNKKKNKYSTGFNGTLKELTSFSLGISSILIDSIDGVNSEKSIHISEGYLKKFKPIDLLDSVLFIMNDTLIKYEKKVSFLDVKLKDSKKLWDTTQITWDIMTPKVMIGENRLAVNNSTIKEVFTILSQLKGSLIQYNGKNEQLYDWDFNYLYNEFMIEELESSFGIVLIKKMDNIIHYRILPKK